MDTIDSLLTYRLTPGEIRSVRQSCGGDSGHITYYLSSSWPDRDWRQRQTADPRIRVVGISGGYDRAEVVRHHISGVLSKPVQKSAGVSECQQWRGTAKHRLHTRCIS